YSAAASCCLASGDSFADFATTAAAPLSSAAFNPWRSIVDSPEPAITGFFRFSPHTVTTRSAGIGHRPARGRAQHGQVGGQGHITRLLRNRVWVRGEG